MQQTNPLFITCEGLPHPIGIDNPFPVFTWKLCGSPHAEKQKKIRILVAGSRDNLLNQTELLWDCEKETEEISLIYGGSPLESRSSYYYKIILTCSDNSVVSSDICLFETGFLSHDCWHAKWICLSEAPLTKDCPEINEEGEALPIQLEDILLGPVHQTRREFTVKKELRHARLYMTAHGIYLPMLDGKKIGHYELAPGHSDYQNQLFYQIYDITEDLAEGTQTASAIGCIDFVRFGLPILVYILVILLLKFYKLDDKTISQIQKELAERKNNHA